VQLSFGVANAPSEARYALPVDDAVRDQPQRAPSEVASNIPLRRAGGCIRTAPLAGSIARPLSGRGSGVKRDIAPERRTRRARRPAIDTGRTHGNEEPPVESGVLGLHRPVAGVGVRDHHTASLPARSDNGWRISDGTVRAGHGRELAPRTRK
jgi:hypothetical protein